MAKTSREADDQSRKKGKPGRSLDSPKSAEVLVGLPALGCRGGRKEGGWMRICADGTAWHGWCRTPAGLPASMSVRPWLPAVNARVCACPDRPCAHLLNFT